MTSREDKIARFDSDERWVLEWSPDQLCYHVEMVRELCAVAVQAIAGTHPAPASRWMLLGVFDTQEEAHRVGQLIEEMYPESRKANRR